MINNMTKTFFLASLVAIGCTANQDLNLVTVTAAQPG